MADAVIDPYSNGPSDASSSSSDASRDANDEQDTSENPSESQRRQRRQQQSHRQQRSRTQQRSSREEMQTAAAKTDIKLSSTVAADEITDKTSTRINNMVSNHVDVHQVPEPTTGNGTNHLFDGTKSSTTVAAVDKTTDKISTGINKILLIEDEPHEPTTTFTDVTRQLYPSLLRLLHWIAGLFIFTLSVLTMNFRNWRPCMPISLRKKKKLKIGKGNGNVSSNSMGKMLCGFLCVIALIMVTDANAAMKMDTASSAVTLPTKRTVVPVAVPIVAESVAGSTVGDPAATRQQQQQQDVSRNVDSNEIDHDTTCLPLKLKIATLEDKMEHLKVEVSRPNRHDDSIVGLTRKILAMCSDGSGATNHEMNQEEEHLRPAESLVVASPTMANAMLGDETVRGVESSGISGSLCKALRLEMVTLKETKVVSRGRRLVACDLKESGHLDLVSTGGWNVLSESCVLGSQINVGSGKTMKVKKDPSVSGPVVIDRQATSGDNRHFVVHGSLEMEGITLKGGYAVSFISSNILLLII